MCMGVGYCFVRKVFDIVVIDFLIEGEMRMYINLFIRCLFLSIYYVLGFV